MGSCASAGSFGEAKATDRRRLLWYPDDQGVKIKCTTSESCKATGECALIVQANQDDLQNFGRVAMLAFFTNTVDSQSMKEIFMT